MHTYRTMFLVETIRYIVYGSSVIKVRCRAEIVNSNALLRNNDNNNNNYYCY